MGLTDALKHRSGVKHTSLDEAQATFEVEGEPGAELDLDDLRSTVEDWEGYNYKVDRIELVD